MGTGGDPGAGALAGALGGDGLVRTQVSDLPPNSLGFSPEGRLYLCSDPAEGLTPDPPTAVRLQESFGQGTGHGLFLLGAREARTLLPPTLRFWREFSGLFIRLLVRTEDLEGNRHDPAVPFPAEEILRWLETAPPFRGAEYLREPALRTLWEHMRRAFIDILDGWSGTVDEYFQTVNPLWNMLGRVCFHLAERKDDDPERPFAFLATYTSGISPHGKPAHQPLSEALKEFAGAADRTALIRLLATVHRAGRASPFLKGILDSRRIFQPLLWTVAEAYQFLREIPVYEAAGVVCRVPDWWKPTQRPTLQAQLEIGGRPASELGWNGMLDYSLSLCLDGEPLTAEEWETIRRRQEKLVYLRGRWVEVDADKLGQVLTHFQEWAARRGKRGLSFAEAMRLEAGAALDGNPPLPAGTEAAARVVPGAWLASLIQRLRDPAAGVAVDPGPDLHGTLRPYQVVGLRWLWFLLELGLGPCLADDMGLGKTIQVLALLLVRRRLRGQGGAAGRSSPAASSMAVKASPGPVAGGLADAAASAPGRSAAPASVPPATGAAVSPPFGAAPVDPAPALLVLPASLLSNWEAERQKFAPSLRVVCAHPSSMASAAIGALDEKALQGVDLVMTTYGTLVRQARLRQLHWSLVILDEAQAIKNPDTRQSRAVRALDAGGRLALTGTPVENRLGDLWSIFDFLNPGLLGTAGEFKDFLKNLTETAGGSYAPLRRLVRPYILRRLKTDPEVAPELPPKTEVKTWCSLSREQAVLYETAVNDLKNDLATVDPLQRRGLILQYLLRFKQTCNHPAQWLKDDNYTPAHSGKFARLREICEEVASRGEKVLVFTQFREMTGPIAGFLRSVFGADGLVMHGGTPVRERGELVRRFQEDPRLSWFVLSLKVGGVGLNLTAANHVIHFDRWWNPAVEAQATDRAFRIGQQRNVMVHPFVCRGTLEEKIDRLLESKKAIAAEVLGQDEYPSITELSDRELLSLVRLDVRSALGD
ncbi:MAG: DEAD/DEAH box helicase [Candidatus Riflebacteria bacterium]|nr:DEAD/DEAH box helicase [Candidatus Riflebacteria bacterium]